MNYLKIYDDLIESRKVRPMVDGVYYERHHIVPRCQGGSDGPENLIYLTAEDHFVAHLLLAQGYRSTNLWFACHAMCMPTGGRIIRNRWAFGKIRREFIFAITDQTVYEFRHIESGKVVSATKAEMSSISPDCVAVNLVSGHTKASMGYCLNSTTDEDLLRKIKRPVHTVAKVLHLLTGDVFEDHIGNLKRMLGITSTNFWKLYTGRQTNGFMLL